MEDKILSDIKKLIPKNVTDHLPKKELDPALLYLLHLTENQNNSMNSSLSVLESIEIVLERTWETLNTGHWKDVPLAPRQLYTGAAIIKIDMLLKRYAEEPVDKLGILHSALKTADLSLMLGAPLSSGNCNMAEVAQLLTKAISIVQPEMSSQQDTNVTSIHLECVPTLVQDIPGVRGEMLLSLEKPSLEKFRTNHFIPRVPVKLTGCMTHWPALEKWKNMNYLKKVAGARTVPVELGAHYVDPEWSQKLMTISEFIETHVLQESGDNNTVGYLAQHPLFEQVIGEKRILLYSPDDSENLYPHEGSMLNNTAQVNPEYPDFSKFPKFKVAKAWECHLQPGQMLYIPPKWWHHVRSLSRSFSVSFWWS
ncbi:Lysine-specific demethylase 8 [Blattella germanica]|nr:Lysine-specific demethylase 8 [Blattella germanica]